jgi:hypothetical protein
MLGLLIYIAIGEVRTYREAVTVAATLRLDLAAEDLVHELQRERGLTSGVLGGDPGFRPSLDSQRPRTDAALAGLEVLVRDDTIPGAAAARTALASLDDLNAVRGNVDTDRTNRTNAFAYFTNVIESLQVAATGLNVASDRELAGLRAMSGVKEASAKERGYLAGVLAEGQFTGREYAEFASLIAMKQAAIDHFAHDATAEQLARLNAVWTSDAAIQSQNYEDAALDASDGRPLGISSRVWWDATSTVVNDVGTVMESVGVETQNNAASLQRQATIELVGLAGLALLVGLAVIGEAFLLASSARSITGPLARLAQEAEDVATRRLPAAVARIQAGTDQPPPPPPIAVPARAAAEIRSVAEAFDQVQWVANQLATEQTMLRRNTTESLANLGRRNQNLLRRQLGFISQLEREETDPTALANLFELDHLATRMRRNAESLLVLVGEVSPRRWSAPLPVADVIRAAVAEVEEYRRVDLRRIDTGYIAGASVSHLAHMVAELIENGLAFSPPELDVEIFGQWVGGQYLIAIVDQGVGMTEADLARANARLRGEESFLLGPARFLGHYVVGRLAGELGIAVELLNSPVTGVTARLILPPSLVSTSAEQPAPEPRNGRVGVDLALPARQPKHSAPVDGDAAALEHSGTLETPVEIDPTNGAPVGGGLGMPKDWPPIPHSSPSWTRSGLLKRAPRRRERVPEMQPAPTPREGPAVDRQPAEVRAMLSAFRAGTRRGEALAADGDSAAYTEESASLT